MPYGSQPRSFRDSIILIKIIIIMPLRLGARVFFCGNLLKEVINLSANVEAKKQVVEDIKTKIQNAKSVVLVNYSGLTVAEDTEFRTEFRKAGVEYKVLKNTLVKKAFNELGITDFDADLNGPTAVAFGPDETSSSKVVMDSIKKYNKMEVKSAYVEAKYVDAKGVEALSAIPSREELYAKCAGALQSIIAGLAVALKAVAEKNA